MIASIGYLMSQAHVTFPGMLSTSEGKAFADLPSDALGAWAAVPEAGKMQIFAVAGLIEIANEVKKPHYMKAGMPTFDRSTRKGQLKSFKESVNYLKKGVGVFAFPEGTRSRSGRMMPFKGGVFAMATKAGVPIVPITVCGTYYTYPSQAILPLRPNPVDDNWLHAALLEQGIVPAGAAEEALEVHIHPQISSDGRTEAELEELTRAAILSKLPKVNHPLEA